MDNEKEGGNRLPPIVDVDLIANIIGNNIDDDDEYNCMLNRCIDILDKSDEQIIYDIKQKLLNNCIGFKSLEEYYKVLYDILKFENQDEDFDDKVINTCKQISSLFNRYDIKVSLMQAYYIWSKMSKDKNAVWLDQENDDDCWLSIIINWVYTN